VRRVLLALALFLCIAPVAAADGDPASDVLVDRNVFMPYPPPSAASSASLTREVRVAYGHDFRVKVAVIATATDLGSVPSLFDKPDQYAAFLGQELQLYYVGPLLIVMPAGYGVYDGGRSTRAERSVIATAPAVPGSNADALTNSAARLVHRLVAAGALKSKDVTKPYVAPAVATVSPGRRARLYYQVFDDSGKTRERLAVRVRGSRVVKSWSTKLRATAPGKSYSVPWSVPAQLRGPLRFCVAAYDPSGNHAATQCARITISAHG
jgi:hypothetical protein